MPDEQVATQGEPSLPPPRPYRAEMLFAGPPEDPDRYELVGPGIAGGEGITWRARYRGSLRSPLPLAIKLLRAPSTAGPDWPTAADRRRWRDQAAILRYLHTDQVVRLNEVFAGPPPHPEGLAEPGAWPSAYVEMEWVEGPTLAQLLRGHPATSSTIVPRLQYLVDVATALTALHSHTQSGGNPSVHRDVTPANCIVNDRRGVVLIDLSAMRLLDDSADPAGLHTPEYTAPEVLRALHSPRDATADAYALGALAVFCLTGQDPPCATAAGMLDLAGERVRGVAVPAGVRDPELLVRQITAMLDPNPSLRPANMIGWASHLVDLAHDRGRRSRTRFRRLALGSAALLVAAGGALAVVRPHVFWTALGGTPGTGSQAARSTTPATAGPAASITSAPPAPTLAVGQPVSTTLPTETTPPSTKPATTTAPPRKKPALSGSITAPADQAAVYDCSYFSGRASLPAGTTLVMAASNLSNPDAGDYADEPFGWQSYSGTVSWRGALYFNDRAIGQRFLITLRAIPIATVERLAVASTDERNTMASMGKVVASIEVNRVDGTLPGGCSG